MRFRSKIFLSVFLPSVLLVGITATVALRSLESAERRNAESRLRGTARAFEDALLQQFARLGIYSIHFMNPRVEEAVSEALEKGDVDFLRDAIEAEFSTIEFKPHVFEVRGPGGRLVLRGPKPEGGPPQPWESAPGRTDALTELDGEASLAARVRYPQGGLLFSTNFRPELDKLRETMRIDIVLERGGRVVYSSLAGAAPAPPGEGEAESGGALYLSRELKPGKSEFGRVVLLYSLRDVQLARTAALQGGVVGLGLAALVAGLVSSVLARGVSRPVEALVAATKRVGEGDYSAKVDVPGRDELARLGSAFNDMTEGLRKRREIMEKTLTRDVAEELMKGVELGGERREVTVMFMDVRGFTKATEGVDPAEVVAMLNDMMGELAAAIARQGGNVNKFLGDGLLAMFGAPKDLPDHALKAARAALEMQSAMAAWAERRKGRGLPPLHIGIGLNTGIVLGGKVGSKERLEYTLIGEEVNLASRVCGKALPGQVLATKTTADRLSGRLALTELEPVQVKGLSYPVQIYEVKA